ncbi:Hsp20/alpha crystallin family protein [Ereboglobus luteus]|uniref:SHSP domain-containing protein n=1 Tax=Ereboglobus luteus TaxID=1796921 RepID=A0A2U8E745_9BACT|nr:Hsp20/alpha crystallin family protein [Ereboglobus luteus]AWI10673.1 hypothetical protein CKA38_12145 [Ereboglobus luteus]
MKMTRYAYPYTLRPASAFGTELARRMAGDFDTQFEDLFGLFWGGKGNSCNGEFFPLDIYEDKDNSYVRAELPGIARGDITVEVVDGSLEISAARKTGDGDNSQTVTLKRSVLLPENTQADKISAASENGILTITLPKQEQAKPRKLTISVN